MSQILHLQNKKVWFAQKTKFHSEEQKTNPLPMKSPQLTIWQLQQRVNALNARLRPTEPKLEPLPSFPARSIQTPLSAPLRCHILSQNVS